MVDKIEYKIVVDGTDVSTYVRDGGWRKNDKIEGDEANVVVEQGIVDEFSDVNPTAQNGFSGRTIEIEEIVDGTTRREFNGFIKRAKGLKSGREGFKFFCVGKLWKAVKSKSKRIYNADTHPTNGVISEIAKDLLEKDSGMSVDAVNSGSDYKIQRFPCRGQDTSERVTKLVVETLQWHGYYDHDNDKAIIEPVGDTVNDNTLVHKENGSDLMASPDWEESVEDIIMELEVVGGTDVVIETITKTSDGSQNEVFELPFEPVNVKVTNTTDSEELEGGRADARQGDFDYVVIKEEKEIRLTDSYTDNSDGDTFEIELGHAVPTPVKLEETEANDKYPFKSQETMTRTDVKDVDDARNRGERLLRERSKQKFDTDKLIVRRDVAVDYNIQPGQVITVEDQIYGVNQDLVVRSMQKKLKDNEVILEVGSSMLGVEDVRKNMIRRINQLEDQYSEDQDLLTVIKRFTVEPVPQIKQMTVRIDDINDSFMVGHPVNGVLHDSNSAFIIDEFE